MVDDTTVRLICLSQYTLESNIRNRRHIPAGAGASMTRRACNQRPVDDGKLLIGVDLVFAVGTRASGAHVTRPFPNSDLISMANADFPLKART